MRKAERTRQYIIESTAPLFNRLGYKGTSLSALTEATGMTKGAIYGNFNSKEELALAVFDHNFAKLQQTLRVRVKEAPNAPEKLRVYLTFYRQAYNEASFPVGGCPLLNAGVEADDGVHPALHEKVKEALGLWEAALLHILQEGKKRKQLREVLQPEAFASLFMTLIEGGLFLSRTTENFEHLQHSPQHLDDLISFYSK